ncbi:uncharacterized protein N7487_003015 [Penicillium crustosum]|uniref:uncharacterized protein n=1 Tax=Penicillium crustosum TaxID=36656 RepID=UPI0023857338|nr:uncharacterized protein N7487_003015 [Penicillium crustosum]KAJ5419465.1 hypothetical protein N7487_003015 [Penicillium crustosum]
MSLSSGLDRAIDRPPESLVAVIIIQKKGLDQRLGTLVTCGCQVRASSKTAYTETRDVDHVVFPAGIGQVDVPVVSK